MANPVYYQLFQQVANAIEYCPNLGTTGALKKSKVSASERRTS
jgi:hypothetical protein